MDTADPTPMPTLCEGLVEAIAASLRADAGAQGVELAVARSSEDVVARVDRKVLSMIVMGLVRHAVTGVRRGKGERRAAHR